MEFAKMNTQDAPVAGFVDFVIGLMIAAIAVLIGSTIIGLIITQQIFQVGCERIESGLSQMPLPRTVFWTTTFLIMGLVYGYYTMPEAAYAIMTWPFIIYDNAKQVFLSGAVGALIGAALGFALDADYKKYKVA